MAGGGIWFFTLRLVSIDWIDILYLKINKSYQRLSIIVSGVMKFIRNPWIASFNETYNIMAHAHHKEVVYYNSCALYYQQGYTVHCQGCSSLSRY